MIVFVGDWIKFSGMWKQIVSVNANTDTFATLDSDGALQWWGTESPEFFEDHVSNIEMQDKLREKGL